MVAVKNDAAPLKGLLVLDMSQFLSGPSAALRLADLGARVIKIERPGSGDICRHLYLTDTDLGGDSTLFHAINRNKESFAADLKDPDDLGQVKKLISRADVIVQNFRPGVSTRLGLDYPAVHEINPRVVYGSISGYGTMGPWVGRPGQDLLAQALSGAMWLSGSATDGPVPFGLSVADMLAGHILVEGILAALVARSITGSGTHVETSLLEAMVDFQFEVLTTHLNDGGRFPKRSAVRNAHAYLGAPYGVYQTADGYLALAMTPLNTLADILGMPELSDIEADPTAVFQHRDAIKATIATRVIEQTTEQWLSVLDANDVWCAPVLGWPEMLASEGFKSLDMLQTVTRADGLEIATTRTPIRIGGDRPDTPRSAPRVGEDNVALCQEFGLG